jgi:outer membrane murein-binding lipoprotein Lpp
MKNLRSILAVMITATALLSGCAEPTKLFA